LEDDYHEVMKNFRVNYSFSYFEGGYSSGKVVLVPPDQIGVSDVQAAYTLSKKRK